MTFLHVLNSAEILTRMLVQIVLLIFALAKIVEWPHYVKVIDLKDK